MKNKVGRPANKTPRVSVVIRLPESLHQHCKENGIKPSNLAYILETHFNFASTWKPENGVTK